MGFLESFNRGLSGDDGYEFAGRQVACSHCGGTAFDERSAQLNTMGLTFLDLDWAERRGPRLQRLRPPRMVLVTQVRKGIK